MTGSCPVIAERTLSCETGNGVVDVVVRFRAPKNLGNNWRCEYEIGWPSGSRKSFAGGVDGVQALLLAFMKAGAELYFMRPSGCEKLWWLEIGEGYGLPLPPSVRDRAIGGDRSV